MRRLGAILISLTGGMILAACTLPPAPVLRQDIQPLGRQWVYRVADRQGRELGTITTKVVAVEGTKVTQETTEAIGGTTTTRKASATFQPDGSLLVEDADGHISPLPSVRKRLVPGASWSNPDGTTTTVEGQESVTVPAGTYLAYRMKQTKSGSPTVTDWFFESIGLVKEVTDETTVELVSVTNR